MKKLKKILCAVISAIMLLSLLTACQTPEDESVNGTDSDTGDSAESEATDKPNKIYLTKDGNAEFRIVYVGADNKESAEYANSELSKKSGAIFDVISADKVLGDKPTVYVGNDYNSELSDGTDKMTYKGYGVFYRDGDIYICGGGKDTVGQAVRKWLSSISVNDSVEVNAQGKKSLWLGDAHFFEYVPEYAFEKPSLLSADLWDYSVVYGDGAGYTTYLLCQALINDIGTKTGCILSAHADSAAETEREIIFGSTSRKALPSLGADEYAITSEGTKIYINFGSFPAAEAAVSEINEMWNKESVSISGKVQNELYVEKPADEIRIMTSNVLFYNSDNTGLGYKERAQLLRDLYLDFSPDFIGLQEAAGAIGDDIAEGLSEKYTRITQTLRGHTPILYRHDLWKPVTTDGGDTVKGVCEFKGDVCWGYEWVLFESLADGQQILVMNLHFHPIKHGAGKEIYRAESMELFNAEVKRLEALYPDTPMAITGDYNTSISYVTDKNDAWENIVGGTKLVCGSQLTENSDDASKTLIDHITVNPELVTVSKHVQVSYTSMQSSSDHKPVFIDLKIKK